MHKNAQGRTREEIVKQVLNKDPSIYDYISHIPIGKASLKIKTWEKGGAEICYLSALTESKRARGDEIIGKEGLKIDNFLLKKYNFPVGKIYHREPGEQYSDVVKKIRPLPDILIEDDCESIGKGEITYFSLPQDVKSKIKSIIVKEFGGIDHLPDKISDLKNYQK